MAFVGICLSVFKNKTKIQKPKKICMKRLTHVAQFNKLSHFLKKPKSCHILFTSRIIGGICCNMAYFQNKLDCRIHSSRFKKFQRIEINQSFAMNEKKNLELIKLRDKSIKRTFVEVLVLLTWTVLVTNHINIAASQSKLIKHFTFIFSWIINGPFPFNYVSRSISESTSSK